MGNFPMPIPPSVRRSWPSSAWREPQRRATWMTWKRWRKLGRRRDLGLGVTRDG